MMHCVAHHTCIKIAWVARQRGGCTCPVAEPREPRVARCVAARRATAIMQLQRQHVAAAGCSKRAVVGKRGGSCGGLHARAHTHSLSCPWCTSVGCSLTSITGRGREAVPHHCRNEKVPFGLLVVVWRGRRAADLGGAAAAAAGRGWLLLLGRGLGWLAAKASVLRRGTCSRKAVVATLSGGPLAFQLITAKKPLMETALPGLPSCAHSMHADGCSG